MASTALAIASIYKASSVEANIEVIAGIRGQEAAEAWTPWIRAGRQVRFSSEIERGQLAEAAAKFMGGISIEDQQKTLELLEKEQLSPGQQLARHIQSMEA